MMGATSGVTIFEGFVTIGVTPTTFLVGVLIIGVLIKGVLILIIIINILSVSVNSLIYN